MSEYQWLKEFSWNLRDLMRETDISQKQLAKESGVSQPNISRYLRAEQLPTITNVINMAYAMDYELYEMLDQYELID